MGPSTVWLIYGLYAGWSATNRVHGGPPASWFLSSRAMYPGSVMNYWKKQYCKINEMKCQKCIIKRIKLLFLVFLNGYRWPLHFCDYWIFLTASCLYWHQDPQWDNMLRNDNVQTYRGLSICVPAVSGLLVCLIWVGVVRCGNSLFMCKLKILYKTIAYSCHIIYLKLISKDDK